MPGDSCLRRNDSSGARYPKPETRYPIPILITFEAKTKTMFKKSEFGVKVAEDTSYRCLYQ
ncbi:MAG TPA: hypothetical protein DC042_00675 [Bacteroidales bacterium]|nr:hypothetical protein [Bacteroidales bacterium]